MNSPHLLVFGANSRLALSFINDANLDVFSKLTLFGRSSKPVPPRKFHRSVVCVQENINAKTISRHISQEDNIYILYIDGSVRGVHPSAYVENFRMNLEFLLDDVISRKNIVRCIVVGSIEAITPRLLSLNDSYTKIKMNEYHRVLSRNNDNYAWTDGSVCYIMFPPLGSSNRLLGRFISISYERAGKNLAESLFDFSELYLPFWLAPIFKFKKLLGIKILMTRYFI